MQSRNYRSSWFLAAVLAFAAAPSHALATIETNVSGISCGITDSSGATMLSDCTSLSFAVTLQPGQSAFVSGTFSYRYTDDGLPMSPYLLPPTAFASFPVPATFETGVLLFNWNCANGRVCSQLVPPGVDFGFPATPGLSLAQLLGYNDQSDDISGSFDVTVSASVSTTFPSAYSTTLFFDAQAFAFSAPVPEPATIGLMASGLLLGAALRRRRKT
jgi:PEP-CTERM motif